jgi:hypothetical protein
MLRAPIHTTPGGAVAEPDQVYFARRAAEEEGAAAAARNEATAQIHRKLARKYAALAAAALDRAAKDGRKGDGGAWLPDC